jgi:hypothetical protein
MTSSKFTGINAEGDDMRDITPAKPSITAENGTSADARPFHIGRTERGRQLLRLLAAMAVAEAEKRALGR